MLTLTEEERRQYWHSHISNFIASKKTQKQYCKDNDISYAKFKTGLTQNSFEASVI